STLAGVGFEYRIRARDVGGNVLAEIEGNQPAPPSHHSEPIVRTRDRTAPAPHSSAWAWLPPTLGGAGVLALAASAYFQVQRERAAREWNGPQCERPGQTRIEQCRSVDDRRRQMQTLAVSGAAGGGALLLSGALAFFIEQANSASEQGERARGPRSRTVGVRGIMERPQAPSGAWSCSAGGLGLHCFGQF
ncbi:MAG TPA: hypothetical protein VFQ61_00515, partial [Polyangiaceae bacterium]|nr:hypothetical protein [Polyangiaceae bacterium]